MTVEPLRHEGRGVERMEERVDRKDRRVVIGRLTKSTSGPSILAHSSPQSHSPPRLSVHIQSVRNPIP